MSYCGNPISFSSKIWKQRAGLWKIARIYFWISLFIVFYTYAGWYIIICYSQDKSASTPTLWPMPTDNALPPLTLFIAAYIEDGVDEKCATVWSWTILPTSYILW